METLSSLATVLSADLMKLSGQKVTSALEAYKRMLEVIPQSRFHQILKELEMEDIISLGDSISDMRYVFLRTSPGDEHPQKIMRLDAAIEYFDENAIEAGGVVTSWTCTIVEEGEKVRDTPLPKIVLSLKLADEKEKEKLQLEEIEKRQSELDKLKKEHKLTLEVIDGLQERMQGM